jgi:hypothetical protein
MIPDINLQIWNGAVPARTTASNSIDLDTLRNIGVGTPLYMRVNFNTNLRADAPGQLQFEVVFATNGNLTTGLKYLNIVGVDFTTTTGPDAGEVLYIAIPPVSHFANLGTKFETPDAASKYFGFIFAGYGWASASGSVTVDIVTEVNRVENIYDKGFTVQ